MKRRGFEGRVTGVVIVALEEPGLWTAEKLTGVTPTRPLPAERKAEWLSEEEMPDRNVDGTPMVSGIDLNGRPYGRSAAWEDEPWHVAAARLYGPSPMRKASAPDHSIEASASRTSCTISIVVIDRRRCHMRRSMRGVRPAQCGARFHRSASSRRARRKRHAAASSHRYLARLWIAISADALLFDSGGTPSTDAGR